MRRFSFHLGLLSFVVALIFCQTSQSASAQRGNQSDVTGALVTGSDISGGTFSGSHSNSNTGFTGSNTSNGIFSPARGINFRFNHSSEVAINKTAERIVSQLSQNKITSLVGVTIPNETQRTLLTILTASKSEQANADTRLTSTLLVGGPKEQIEQLVNRLKGLIKTGSSKTGKVDATKLFNAIEAYNNVINNSSSGYLSNPPSGLLAIQSVISQLSNSVPSQPR